MKTRKVSPDVGAMEVPQVSGRGLGQAPHPQGPHLHLPARRSPAAGSHCPFMLMAPAQAAKPPGPDARWQREDSARMPLQKRKVAQL